MAKHGLGKLIEKIGGFITKLFGNKQDAADYLLEHADEGIAFAQKVLDAVQSPEADAIIYTIEAFTPPGVDLAIEKIRAAFIERNKKILEIMLEAKACVGLPDFPSQVKCLVDQLKALPSAVIKKKAVLAVASAYTRLSAEESGHVIKESLSDAVVQMQLVANKIELGTA